MAGHSGSVTQATVLSDHSPFIHRSKTDKHRIKLCMNYASLGTCHKDVSPVASPT